MNLHQPLSSSCYLNTSENVTVFKSNLNSVAPKLQRRKNRLHLGAKRVDPSIFHMVERENEKKTLTNAVTNRSRVGIELTNTKYVSTENQESEEESYVSRDGPISQDSCVLQSRTNVDDLITHNEGSFENPTKVNKEQSVNLDSYPQTSNYVEPTSPNLNQINLDEEAQKKFGSAKSISSEEYFNDDEDSREGETDLSRFNNCSAISSDDLFNRASTEPNIQDFFFSSTEPNIQDFFFSSLDNISYEELAACLRKGVTKVAGKLGSVMNSFASRLPPEFGEY